MARLDSIGSLPSPYRARPDAMHNFLTDETGLELTEYAVACALIAMTVVATFTTLGDVIGEKIQGLATRISE